MIEFKYEMDHILEDVPDAIKGTIKGSIIAKADRMEQADALDFIDLKVKDKTITEETGKRLGNLLRDFCIYR